MITIQNASGQNLQASRWGTNTLQLSPGQSVTLGNADVVVMWTNGTTATVSHSQAYARAVVGVPGSVDLQDWDWTWSVALVLWGLLFFQKMLVRLFTRIFGASSDNLTE